MASFLSSMRRGWQAVSGVWRGRGRQGAARTRNKRRKRARLIETMERRDTMSASPMAIGMNLDSVNDYTPNWMFTDIFQHSRPWISHAYNTVTRQFDFNGGSFVPVQTDANGWPTQLATWQNANGHVMQQRLGTLMFRELNGNYPAGTYRAEWTGTGDLQFGFDAREISRGRTDDGRNFAVLNVTPGQGGIYLSINSMSNADPIRDVHVWMPDYNGQSFAGQRWQPGADFSPFHPLYRERLSDFGILRFMQTQETNTSDIQSWSDRRDTNDARQASGMSGPMANGISVEHMVQLANELDADPWFNMPHQADDGFVRNFATYVRDNLEPGRKAYVEWSNEVWNSAPGFESYAWIAEQTRLPANAGLTHWQIVGREAARDMDIWSEVFTGQTERIVRTAGGMAANSWITERILENMNGSFDAIAIAPYFGPSAAQRASYSATTSIDQVLADMRGNIAVSAQMTVSHQQLADDFATRLGRDIQLLAYEGGPHLDSRGGSYQNVFHQATKDPRMADVLRDYLRMQNAAGLDAYVHYKLTDRDQPSQWGLFGVLLAQDQPLSTAHSYRALLEASAGTLFTTTPTLVTINAADPIAHEAGLGTASFRVTRGGDLTQPLTVSYAVAGTASAGADYGALSGSVTFPANENTALITITPLDDARVEAPETVIVTLQPGFGYSLISTATSTGSVRIASDDVSPLAPTLNIVATDPNAAEAGRDPGQFTVTRTGNVDRALTAYLVFGQQTATAADFQAIPMSVTFGVGQSAVNIPVIPIDDTAVENTETVVLAINPANHYLIGSQGAARLNILSDDLAPAPETPRVSVAATDAIAHELGNDRGVFTLTRTGNLNSTLVARYTASGTAVGGLDYAPLSGFASFARGQATATVTVIPYNDPTIETLETIMIKLADTADYDLGAVDCALVELISDEQPPTVTIAATDALAAEAGRDPGQFTLTRTGPTTAPLTVNLAISGAATNGVDYDAIGATATIPAGQSSTTVVLRPIDDTLVDANESATLSVAPSAAYTVGSAGAASVTIADNDAAPILPVLMVIANRDFYYQEYAEPRAQLETAGIGVVVAAARRELSTPHANSGQGSGTGQVMPDIALANVRAADYSAIVFVGGWGASQYQFAFGGTYQDSAYNGSADLRLGVNQLINDFVAQGKFVTALCHGVSVLAWARVNNESPLRGRTVSIFAGPSPPSSISAAQLSRWHADTNGATVFTNGQYGNTGTAADDVIVDGQFITAENYDTARLFGQVVANRLRGR